MKVRWSVFLLLVLSVFFCIESWRLGLGNLRDPGSGFLPFGASLAVGVLSGILFLKERGKQIDKSSQPVRQAIKAQNSILIVCVLLIYPFLLSKLGYFVSTFLFVLFCVKIVGAQKWRIVLLISIVTAIIAYLFFVVWLDVRTPEGTWMNHFASWRKFLWK